MFLKKILNKLVSIRVRLTMLFVLLFGTTIIAFSTIFYNVFMESHQREFDTALYNYAVDVLESITLNSSGDLSMSSSVDFDQGKVFPFPMGTALMQIRTIQGKVLTQYGAFGDFHPPFKEDFILLAHGQDAAFRTIKNFSESRPMDEASTYRLISFPIDNSPIPKLILQIAVPLNSVRRQAQNLKIFFLTTVPAILLIATILGYYFSKRALQPISEIIDKASDIKPNQLSNRLPVPKVKDEIRQLAETLNEMLERMELSFRSQERFIADASHQLLTPLATLRVELDVLSQKNPDEVKAFLESASQEIDRLSRIVQDMLLLAQIDAGKSNLTKHKFSLEEIIFSELSKLEKIAAKKNVKMRFNILDSELNEPHYILADNDLIGVLLHNAIENAIKYSPQNGLISIELTSSLETYILSIKDSGPGIPEEQLPLVFKRFYRAPLTSRQAKGFGLGLAIAKNIAELHGAHLQIKNLSPHGACLSFEIKKFS